jgi:hypothetical protein
MCLNSWKGGAKRTTRNDEESSTMYIDLRGNLDSANLLNYSSYALILLTTAFLPSNYFDLLSDRKFTIPETSEDHGKLSFDSKMQSVFLWFNR